MRLFRLQTTDSEGRTLAEKGAYLEAAGIHPDFMDGPEMPEAAERSWAWFQDLSMHRSKGFGEGPISWSDIHAYFLRLGIQTRPWEIRLISAFDSAFMTTAAKKEK